MDRFKKYIRNRTKAEGTTPAPDWQEIRTAIEDNRKRKSFFFWRTIPRIAAGIFLAGLAYYAINFIKYSSKLATNIVSSPVVLEEKMEAHEPSISELQTLIESNNEVALEVSEPFNLNPIMNASERKSTDYKIIELIGLMRESDNEDFAQVFEINHHKILKEEIVLKKTKETFPNGFKGSELANLHMVQYQKLRLLKMIESKYNEELILRI